MSARDSKQPYMVYEGPRPRRAVSPEGLAAEVNPGAEARREAGVEIGSRGHGLGVGLVVVAALAMGVAIGLWAAPNLRHTATTVQPEPTALAMSVIQPTEEPPAAALDLRSSIMAPTPDDPPGAETLKTKTAKAARPKPARATQSPQRARKVARNYAVPKPKPEGVVRTRTSRSELADWLAGEPARRSAAQLTDAHEDPVGEIIATTEEPPHP